MPSMQATILLTTTLLGSLLQQAAAAPEASIKRADVQYPPCIMNCLRDSGCSDAQCVCSKVSDGVLSDIVICMNQWCTADITAKNLIQPLAGQCDLPKSAVQDAEKKGGILDASSADATSAGNPKTTSAPSASSSGDVEITMSWELGPPLTFPAEPTTTTGAPVDTLLVAPSAAQTGAATKAGNTGDSTNETTGDNSKTTAADSTGAATSTLATSALTMSASATSFANASASASASASSSASSPASSDDSHNGAGFTGQASIFGVVAAMAITLALGF